ncbi:MAG: uracil-DNA glycosylase [Flavobacteriales bacterium]|nr:uracil-DNA glycosylase [Flavobacteriales bacterium]
MEVQIESSWKEVLEDEFKKEYFTSLTDFVKKEYKQYTCYPKGSQVFSAFDLTPFDDTKVVILGQDPYHGEHQAHGLCFSVNEGIPFPPSLKNIFKELESDLGIKKTSGNLESWSKQGVLLLNATLTVRANQAGSHQNQGWETFTDKVIQTISEKKENVVFILWGSYAQRKISLIDTSKHHIIKSAHPSPLSVYRGFWNSKPFSKTNDFLASKNKKTIEW